ncbi:DNA-binding response regulator, OmpR family, contains REC and winged-helix (wHTH) domain [Seinonella peptonophila]|uniref:DNA-binding response regulator, OmpR family, contains REC and winged-helix (WHTH) domain n=1 Tax=Seinonella peptonophila TaxID=112248 RepID=A0A1M4SSG4_9BACL|nr:response regulator transcription factor [Seinonella peptonophila]SHE35170.1 DNA-binding response regulator, OmpR family, contains REC and winged-helix (wHTH) domain [Seinonella peptonophila]
MNIQILIIEDDVEINQLVAKYLSKEGFHTHSVYNGEEALSHLSNHEYQLIILDLMLPKVDGQEILRKIREKKTTPVIILSARDREMDKILGLGLGADDYMTKPFTIGELIARVKAQLRRYMDFNSDSTKAEPKIFKHGSLELHTSTYEVKVSGHKKLLTSKEFAILKLFLTNPTRVFSKSQVFQTVWKEDSLAVDNTVMVHINRLRTKIEPDPSNPVYIQTVWGFGYKLGEGC